MIRFGPSAEEMRKMSKNDIFSSRLKLLIIMAKSYLKGYPVGKFRKQAIIENSRNIFYKSLQLVSETVLSEDRNSKAPTGTDSKKDIDEAYIFHQRVQLLTVMARAFAENRLKGPSKEKAFQDNLSRICETLIFKFNINDVKFLKVA